MEKEEERRKEGKRVVGEEINKAQEAVMGLPNQVNRQANFFPVSCSYD